MSFTDRSFEHRPKILGSRHAYEAAHGALRVAGCGINEYAGHLAVGIAAYIEPFT